MRNLKILTGVLVILLTLGLTSCLQECPPPTGEPTAEMMELITGYVDAYNAHDVDRIMSYYTEDCQFFGIGKSEGNVEKEREYVVGLFKAFPDFKVTINQDGVQIGDHIFLHYTMSGTNTGPNWTDQPPIGTAFKDIEGLREARVVDGKIKYMRDFHDGVALYLQMGYTLTRPSPLEAKLMK